MSGKAEAQRRALAAYLKANPQATVARYVNGRLAIEKPVVGGSHEFVNTTREIRTWQHPRR